MAETTTDTIKRIRTDVVSGKKPDDAHLSRLTSEDVGMDYYAFMYFLVQELKPEVCVELGTEIGKGAMHLASGCPSCHVYAVDIVKHGAFDNNTSPYPNIEFVLGRSDSLEVLSRVDNVDLCFVDSVHAVDYVLREVELWTPKMRRGGIFLFDDLDWDDGMRQVMSRLPFKRKGNLHGLHFSGFGYAIVS